MFVPPQVSMQEKLGRYGRDLHMFSSESSTTNNGHQATYSMELDKIRIAEALIARDVVAHRLEGACTSIRQKELAIERLEREKEDLKRKLISRGDFFPESRPDFTTNEDSEERQTRMLVEQIERLEEANRELKEEIEALKVKHGDDTGAKDEGSQKGFPVDEDDGERSLEIKSPNSVHSNTLANPYSAELEKFSSLNINDPSDDKSPEPDKRVQARFDILATLPIPTDIPADTLVPIVIPAPFSIHDFLGTTSGSLKSQLANYRVFQESTTSWCPDREEHGYFLTALFKCATNPRVATAHRWILVDLAPKLNKPTECFYNKDNKWYYAGVYTAFRLDDLSTQEWAQLPTETTQTIIKDTLAGRKNISPQNVYETGQLYAAGALKVACIGLQCVGFNRVLYKALLEQAEVCTKSGRWRGTPSVGDTGPAAGLGTGTAWNVSANAVWGRSEGEGGSGDKGKVL